MGQTRKRGRSPGEFGVKSATLSLRIEPNIRTALMEAATKKKRSLNREIISRLRSTLGRENRPPHIRALSEMVELAALGIERKTKRRFTEDRYTAERLAKAVELLLQQYSPQAKAGTKAAVPPAVTEATKTMGDTYPDQLGVIEAGAVIALLEGTLAPPGIWEEQHWPPKGYDEGLWGLWRLREDLGPRRRK